MEADTNPKVMIVDDDYVSRTVLGRIIESNGYEAWLCSDTKEAFERLDHEIPDMILSDISMPNMDGYTFCTLLKEQPKTRDIPVIFISAMDTSEKKVKGLKLGAVDFITKPYVKEEVVLRIKTQLDLHLMHSQLEQYNYQLNAMVTKQMQTIENVKKTALVALAKVTEGNRKIANENHLENIAYNARLLAQALAFTKKYENKISEQFIQQIEMASTIHDIGKIAIPESILLKPAALTEQEREIIKKHPQQGLNIFDEVFHDIEEDEFMKIARNIVLYHHEHFAGGGYPCGIAGEDIPLEARIVMIVDVYDTLRGERCYKPAYSFEESKRRMATIYKGCFDPEIEEVFWKIEKQLKKGKG